MQNHISDFLLNYHNVNYHLTESVVLAVADQRYGSESKERLAFHFY